MKILLLNFVALSLIFTIFLYPNVFLLKKIKSILRKISKTISK